VMRCTKAILALAALGSSSVLAAQTDHPVVETGDTILGMGSMTSLDMVNVNDAKMWTALIDTTFSDTGQDGCLLRSGFVTMREGMFFPNPVGSSVDEFDSIDINGKGDLGLCLRARIPGLGGAQEALAWNLKFIALVGDPFVSPFVPAGTKWDSFDIVRVNDRNMLLTAGEVKAPQGQNPQRRDALVRYQLDAQGNVLDTTVFGVRSQPVPALPGATFLTLLTPENAYAMNNLGDFIVYATTTGGNGIFFDMTVALAMEGDVSSVGRTWALLNSARVALNDRGDFVLSGTLTGDAASDYLIEKNGEKFVQEGDVLPELSSQPIAGGSNAPVYIGNNGDVFWRANVAGTTTDAFMRNQTPIVVSGSTLVDGKLVTAISATDTGFAASPNGRFFVCSASVAEVGDAVIFVDFGLVLELPGCSGNPGKLTLASGAARVGQQLEFAMDDGHVPGAIARINFSTRQRVPNSDCGVVGPFGESLIDPTRRVGSLFPPPWDGANPSKVRIAIPSDIALVDAVLFAQGQFRRPGSLRDVTLTNALRIEIGSP